MTATTSALPAVERARRYLEKVPGAIAGQRGHDQCFAAACAVARNFPDLSEGDLLALMHEYNARCQPPWSEAELLHKVRGALRLGGKTPGGTQAVPKWPSVDEERRAFLTDGATTLAELWEYSPIRFVDNRSHAEEILDVLYPQAKFGDPLLCCGVSPAGFATQPRSEWRGKLERLALIVPTPMSAVTGLTRDGRESAHTLANTGARRFIVVEFDHGTLDDHAALLWHLATFGPLCMAVHSGNKSLHGWFECEGLDEARLLKFFRYAVSLGADPALWNRSQFARLPDGKRPDGTRQSVMYFNPSKLD